MQTLNDNELESVAGGYGEAGTVASGSFSSSSGTSLNLLVNWSVRSNPGTLNTLYVDVYTSSYALSSQALANGVQLNVNGMVYSAVSSAIDYHGKTLATHHLASFVIPNFIGPANVSAVFHFNGVLSGKPVGDIIAYGTINA